MLVPLIGLILGIAVLYSAFLAYTGSPLIQEMPAVFKQRGNLLWVTGSVLLALALMLGIVGYFGYLDATILRYLRILIGCTGLVILGSQLYLARR
jgi:cell division protein FtsX